MKREVGLWIDNTKSIIVTMQGEKEEIRQVRSNIEKHVHFASGSHSRVLLGTYSISAESKNDPTFTTWLNSYFDGVASLLHNADSIWIFGPGDAKKELEKRLHRNQLGAHIVGIENVEKMTDRQIASKVRLHYQNLYKNDPNGPGAAGPVGR
jgi:hypothetical protein